MTEPALPTLSEFFRLAEGAAKYHLQSLYIANSLGVGGPAYYSGWKILDVIPAARVRVDLNDNEEGGGSVSVTIGCHAPFHAHQGDVFAEVVFTGGKPRIRAAMRQADGLTPDELTEFTKAMSLVSGIIRRWQELPTKYDVPLPEKPAEPEIEWVVCEVCGSEDGKMQTNSFKSDLNGDDTLYPICDACDERGADDL